MQIKDYIEMFRDELVLKHNLDPYLEISKVLQSSRKTPVLFDWKGKKILGNLWADRKRISKALSIKEKELIKTILQAVEKPEPFEVVENAIFTEKLDSLDDIPVLKFFEEDGGKYITSGIISAAYGSINNLSYHRMLVRGKHLVARLVEGRHTDRMYREALKNGDRLKIAIVIGAPLEVMIAAACSVEYGQNELEIASAMHRKAHGTPLKVAMLDGIPVPAESEYVILGEITENMESEGPFVDITGTLDHVREQPVIEINAIYASPEPVYQTILPGGYEHFMMMGLPREATIYREVSRVSEIEDLVLTPGGCSWLHCVISIKKRSEGDVENVIRAAFRGHRSMKRVIVVDDDIDVHNHDEVEWALATRFQAEKDLVIFHERGSSLDPSVYPDGKMDKWGLDATKPTDSRGFDRLVRPG